MTCALSIFLMMFVGSGFTAAHPPQDPRGVPFLTLRDRVSDDDGFYGSQRSTLKAGHCEIDQVSLDFLSKAAEIAPFRIPEEILTLGSIKELEPKSLLSQFAANARDDPILYIHGYYINFEKGCRRATVFKENAGLEDEFLWFSWPSDGSLVNYARDEVNLAWSVPDIAETITDLHARFGSGKVNLAGHSLGGRGLVMALNELSATHPNLRFGEVVLLAPDMDFGTFRKLLPRIRPMADRITIYTSGSDMALEVSAQLHGYPRLGGGSNNVATLKGVEVIDAGDLPMMSVNGHLYHIYNKEVGADLNQLINQGKSAKSRDGLKHVGGNLWQISPQ
jgi:pimeloyl-ACP methyl ester carboxylesterase